MLTVNHLQAWYGRTQALFGMSFHVDAGEAVALVGLNGAGKSTTLGAIAGLIRSTGEILLDEQRMDDKPTHVRARSGMAIIPETRRLFWEMTVRENLVLGGGPDAEGNWEELAELFPIIGSRSSAIVSDLSGGEQQMVAIARALARHPNLLMVDEPVLGLAPGIVKEVYARLAALRSNELAVLLVEQSLERAANYADRLLLVRNKRVAGEALSRVPREVEGLRMRAFHNEPGEDEPSSTSDAPA